MVYYSLVKSDVVCKTLHSRVLSPWILVHTERNIEALEDLSALSSIVWTDKILKAYSLLIREFRAARCSASVRSKDGGYFLSSITVAPFRD